VPGTLKMDKRWHLILNKRQHFLRHFGPMIPGTGLLKNINIARVLCLFFCS
jgi:hypothetical protein